MKLKLPFTILIFRICTIQVNQFTPTVGWQNSARKVRMKLLANSCSSDIRLNTITWLTLSTTQLKFVVSILHIGLGFARVLYVSTCVGRITRRTPNEHHEQCWNDANDFQRWRAHSATLAHFDLNQFFYFCLCEYNNLYANVGHSFMYSIGNC